MYSLTLFDTKEQYLRIKLCLVANELIIPEWPPRTLMLTPTRK